MKHLDKKYQKIIDKYLKQLQKFLKDHNLDSNFKEDIKERINEKLLEKKEISETELDNILKEIGAPKEMFKEELEANLEKKESQNRVIFLGVFKEIGDYTNIKSHIYRIIFLCLLVLFPILGANEVFFIIPILCYFIGFLFLRTGGISFALPVILCAISGVILILSIGLFGLYLSDIHFSNIYPFMGIGWEFPVGMIIGITGLILLTIAFGGYGFFRKLLPKTLFIGFLSCVVGLGFGVVIIYNLIQIDLDRIPNIEGETSISVKAGETLALDMRLGYPKVPDISLDIPFIKITGNPLESITHTGWIGSKVKKSPDNKIHIKYVVETGSSYFTSKKESKKYIEKYIKSVKPKIKNGKLFVEIEPNLQEKYPLIHMHICLFEILLPENVTLEMPQWSPWTPDAIIHGDKKVFEKLDSRCPKVRFTPEDDKVHCIIDDPEG